MGKSTRSPYLLGALAVVVVVTSVVAVMHRMALADVRAAERAYIDGRQITACAAASLAPFASRETDLDDLPAALEQIVFDARDQVVALRDALPRSAAPWWRARPAREAVVAATAAQLRLYEAIAEQPEASDDELEALGDANRRAERALESARSALFVGAAEGWASRNACGATSDD